MIALPLWQQSRVRLWDWQKNKDIATLEGLAYEVAFSSDGKSLLARSNRKARVYRLDAVDGKLKLAGHDGAVTGLAFSPDGRRLASVGKDRAVRIWDTTKGELLWEHTLLGVGQTVAYSPDGFLLATAELDWGLVWVWNARTGKRLLELGTNKYGNTWSTEFSADGRYLASASWIPGSESGIHVWELKQREDAAGELKVEAGPVSFLPGAIHNMAFSPDGKTLAFYNEVLPTSPRASVQVWDFQGSSPVRVLEKYFS